MRAKHVIDRNWDLKKFVTFVRETFRISWKEIYWKVWSYLNLIKCDRCQEYYPVAEMGNCRFHPEPPKLKLEVVWVVAPASTNTSVVARRRTSIKF